MQDPEGFLGKIFWKEAKTDPMKGQRQDSNEAVAGRLKLLRRVVSGENQTAFAARLGLEVKRWNNFERGSPLSKEAAIMIVKRFPNVTLDWLWLGRTEGLPTRFQRELEAAENGTTSAGSRLASD